MLCFVEGLSELRIESYFLHSRTTANFILNGETLETVSFKSGMPYNIVLKMLASAIRQEKQIGGEV